jgi:hypothetical protein
MVNGRLPAGDPTAPPKSPKIALCGRFLRRIEIKCAQNPDH